jgi:2-iminobutanoate/2-iminopropanoate deaminase
MTIDVTPAFGPYSPLRGAGSTYYISGQIGLNPAGKTAAADIAGQTRQALENLSAVLQTAGLKLDNVVKTTVFLTDMGEFAAMNDVYLEYFSEPRPARSSVEVAGLPRIANVPLKVEIEAIALKV